MNPKNYLIRDYFKILAEDLLKKGYDNDCTENVLSAVEAQVLAQGADKALTKAEELEILSSLAAADSYPYFDSEEDPDAVVNVDEYLEEERQMGQLVDSLGSSSSIKQAQQIIYNGKRVMSIILFCTLSILVIGWFFRTQQRIVMFEESVRSSEAQVNNVIQRRYDLIPNLVNTVRGYAEHEKELYTEIARLRSNWSSEEGIRRRETEAELEHSIGKLMLVVEAYPVIKSDQMYANLMASLEGSENRIAVERMRRNESVRRYNTEIKKLPQSAVAICIGAKRKEEYLQISDEVRVNPEVNF